MNNQRTLSLKDLILSGLCIMSPLAPFTAYYQIADASFGMVSLVYLIGMIAMLFIASSFSQLSKAYPISGSAYSYVQRAVNPHLGFIAGWSNLCLYFFIPSFIMIMAGNWLSQLVPSVPLFAWFVLFTIINLFVNIRGAGATAKLNRVLFLSELGLILILMILEIKAVFIDGQGLGGFSLAPIFQAEHFSFSFISVAITLAIFGFLGFDTIGSLADEAKNPKKDIGTSATICIMLAGTFFFFQTYMAGLVAPDYTQLNAETGLFDVARLVGGEVLFKALLIINIIAYGILIPINVQSAVARLIQAMSKDDLIPGSKFFVKVHPKYNTPVRALVTVSVLGLVFALVLDFSIIMSAVNFCAMVMFIILNYAVIKHLFFEKKQRGLKGTIFNFIVPLVALIICIYLLSQFNTQSILLACGMLLIGVIIGFVKSKGYKKEIKI